MSWTGTPHFCPSTSRQANSSAARICVRLLYSDAVGLAIRNRISSRRAGSRPSRYDLKSLNGLDGALAAAAHLAEPDQTLVGLDFYDRANEATPMAAVGVPQRCLERHGDGRGADVGDLHCDTAR